MIYAVPPLQLGPDWDAFPVSKGLGIYTRVMLINITREQGEAFMYDVCDNMGIGLRRL